MLTTIKRWFTEKPANDSDMLADVLAIGHGGPVVLEQPGVELFGDRVRQMQAAGLVDVQDCPAGLLITPANPAKLTWATRTAIHDEAVRRGTYKQKGRFIAERNPTWVAWVHDFRRTNGRQPTAAEMMAHFPVVSRRTAYRYVGEEASQLRLVRSA